MLLAFSPEATHEHPEAELVTFGSSFLDTLDELAKTRGNCVHLYLNGLNPTTGRTLEKVRAQIRLPGHLVESGGEQVLLFHHVLFRFKVSLIGEEREEFYKDVAVDLHCGWTTTCMDVQSLRFSTVGEPLSKPEIGLNLSLGQAYLAAIRALQEEIQAQVKISQEELNTAFQIAGKQVSEHYAALIAKLESRKTHKGADTQNLDAKTQATRTDLELRLEDLKKRYRLGLEIKLTQTALVSYLKAATPLRLQQGKEIRPALAVWDSLTCQGYIAEL